jgi:hypothetical protein
MAALCWTPWQEKHCHVIALHPDDHAVAEKHRGLPLVRKEPKNEADEKCTLEGERVCDCMMQQVSMQRAHVAWPCRCRISVCAQCWYATRTLCLHSLDEIHISANMCASDRSYCLGAEARRLAMPSACARHLLAVGYDEFVLASSRSLGTTSCEQAKCKSMHGHESLKMTRGRISHDSCAKQGSDYGSKSDDVWPVP